ncbi:MAG: YraN family protein [Pseudomonadota bacterium]|nr:YraN family protein [Pseudomonadota bacterium]
MSIQVCKGYIYEIIVKRYLENHGLTFMYHRYKSKYGEIDLVMNDQHTLVFIEVKGRKKHHLADYGYESINTNKQQKICLTALKYIKKHHLTNRFTQYRFDVVYISSPQHIEWIADAFDCPIETIGLDEESLIVYD